MTTTVTHRVEYIIAGTRHYTAVDTIAECRKAVEINSQLGIVSVIQYMGTRPLSTVDTKRG